MKPAHVPVGARLGERDHTFLMRGDRIRQRAALGVERMGAETANPSYLLSDGDLDAALGIAGNGKSPGQITVSINSGAIDVDFAVLHRRLVGCDLAPTSHNETNCQECRNHATLSRGPVLPMVRVTKATGRKTRRDDSAKGRVRTQTSARNTNTDRALMSIDDWRNALASLAIGLAVSRASVHALTCRSGRHQSMSS